MAVKNKKVAARRRRVRTIRKRVRGTPERPRLNVFRSCRHMYAQVVDDASGRTLVSASTLTNEIAEQRPGKKKRELAAMVGKLVAARCLELDISAVVFDRNGFIYHGRIQAVADGAREGGLRF